MSDPIAKHEIIKYRIDEPFCIGYACVQDADDERLHPHWHEELEIIFTLHGHSDYYIDGTHIQVRPEHLLIINSESIHNVLADRSYNGEEPMAVILLIHRRFLVNNIPNFLNLHFLNTHAKAADEIKKVIMELTNYGKNEKRPYEYLYAKGLILQLLSLICEQGVVKKEDISNINYDKNSYRMKGVLQFVENCYKEHITQEEAAKKFYFNKDYFSRCFKKYMGMSFSEYLLEYRLKKAKDDLLDSDFSITEIAERNGFSDDRRLIIAFKKKYEITPLQYRIREKRRKDK